MLKMTLNEMVARENKAEKILAVLQTAQPGVHSCELLVLGNDVWAMAAAASCDNPISMNDPGLSRQEWIARYLPSVETQRVVVYKLIAQEKGARA